MSWQDESASLKNPEYKSFPALMLPSVWCNGCLYMKHGDIIAITVMYNLRINSYEPGHEKTCLMSYANNKGADQPAHPRSLISAFVVRCLDSVMSLVSETKISSLMLASFFKISWRIFWYIWLSNWSIITCTPLQILTELSRSEQSADLFPLVSMRINRYSMSDYCVVLSDDEAIWGRGLS